MSVCNSAHELYLSRGVGRREILCVLLSFRERKTLWHWHLMQHFYIWLVVNHVCDAVCVPPGVPAMMGHLLLVIVRGQKVCRDYILHKHSHWEWYR